MPLVEVRLSMFDRKRGDVTMKRLLTVVLVTFAVLQSSVAYADLKAADRRLNDLYGQVINSLPASNQGQLKESQRNWIKYRDSECRYQQVNYAIMVSEADCKEVLTRQRIGLLSQQLGWLKKLGDKDEADAAADCKQEIGAKAANILVNQCKEISPATNPPCNAANSCDLIRDEIKRGCSMAGDKKPAYCQ
ncbi:lysozyme inhibitor LprI family protein [Brucella sp. 22210]|uniref:lysozyme inhibitor LprI family protein n=2 Tax=Brucella/Ochrobactrum group TaxID=2826938 RepID=UPI003F82B852